jgi:hypothetical protein
LPAAKKNEEFHRRKCGKEAVMKFSTSSEAIAELEREHAPKSASWDYHDSTGEPVGVIVRWDRPDGKDIRPVRRDGDHWVIGGMAAPRPLYRLPNLANAPQVFVCEGEKAADAARSIGLVSTTSPHGANSAAKADWRPLAGKEVVIVPDNDDAGRKYANDVARILVELDPAAQIKVVQLPGVPEHGDIVEWIENHGEAAEPEELRRQLLDLVAIAEPYTTAQPLNVLTRYAPFPVHVLPPPLGDFVSEAARATVCDLAFIVLPLLAALASAIGNTRRIMLKDDWCEPSILWAAILGESGSNKTGAITKGTAILNQLQSEALMDYQSRLDGYEREKLEYEAALAEWKRAKSGKRGDPPEKPIEPVPRRLIVSDATIEALADRLEHAPRGLLLVRDELAGWLRSFDQYKSSKGGDAAHWLSTYNATRLMMDRKTGDRKLVDVPRAAVSITGGIQPETLRRSLGQEHFDDGLASRLLLAYPPKRPQGWTDATVDKKLHRALHVVFERLLLLDFDYGPAGERLPKDLPITAAAKSI